MRRERPTTRMAKVAACCAVLLASAGAGCRSGGHIGAVPFSEAEKGDRPVGPAELGQYELDVLRAINGIRRSHELPELAPAGDLVGLARRQAMDMVRMGRVTHEGGDGSPLTDRARRASVRYRVIGENVAANRGYRDPRAEAVRGWMGSASHKATILHEVYREIGLAVVRCPKTGTWYFATVFCRRAEE